jgi:probable addiction module antidote protein
MAKATKRYSAWRNEKIEDPVRAARYLNAARKESKEAFLHAVKNVVQANQVTRVAREAGVSRENVYRSFSAEGNPTFDTLSAVLEALNIQIEFSPLVSESEHGGGSRLQRGVTEPKFKTRTSNITGTPRSPNNLAGSEILEGYVIRGAERPAKGAFNSYLNLANNGAIFKIPSAPLTQSDIPDYLDFTPLARGYGIGQKNAGNDNIWHPIQEGR